MFYENKNVSEPRNTQETMNGTIYLLKMFTLFGDFFFFL